MAFFVVVKFPKADLQSPCFFMSSAAAHSWAFYCKAAQCTTVHSNNQNPHIVPFLLGPSFYRAIVAESALLQLQRLGPWGFS